MDKEIPEYIFLQLPDDGGGEYGEGESTWCEDQIYDSDIKYKRVAG